MDHSIPLLPPAAGVPAVDDAEDGWDDPDGYYRCAIGEMLADRYRVIEAIGTGMFSGVLRAVDTQSATGAKVAIKIIRCNDMMARAADREIALLERLAREDPADRKRCVRLLGHFTHRKHTCIVFENMDMDLRKLNKQVGGGVGLSMTAVSVNRCL